MNKTNVKNVPSIITKDRMTIVVPHVFQIWNQIKSNQHVFARQDTILITHLRASFVRKISTRVNLVCKHVLRVQIIRSHTVWAKLQYPAVIVAVDMA